MSKKAEGMKILEDKDEPIVVDEHHKDRDDALISVSTRSLHLGTIKIEIFPFLTVFGLCRIDFLGRGPAAYTVRRNRPWRCHD